MITVSENFMFYNRNIVTFEKAYEAIIDYVEYLCSIIRKK